MTAVPRPVVALLTDFGTRDHYVGTMKGVILGICADAALVDLTHDIEPQDILGGALELAAAAPFFPAGTIFVAVVDPGVGSGRRAVAVESGGRWFVGPDNGLIWPAIEALGGSVQAVALDNPRYALPVMSRTFEGRDRFAPAAAWLASGVPLAMLGTALSVVSRLDVPRPRISGEGIDGEVMRVDRFGNLITNISRRAFEACADPRVRVGGIEIRRVAATYAEAERGVPCALFSSTDHLEIAVREGRAGDLLQASRGTAVHVRRGSAA